MKMITLVLFVLLGSQFSFADTTMLPEIKETSQSTCMQQIIECKDTSGTVVVELYNAKMSSPPYYEARVTGTVQAFQGLSRSGSPKIVTFTNNPAFSDRAGGGVFELTIDTYKTGNGHFVSSRNIPSTLQYLEGALNSDLLCSFLPVSF